MSTCSSFKSGELRSFIWKRKIDRLLSNFTASADSLASHVANSSRFKMENDCDMSFGPTGVIGRGSRLNQLLDFTLFEVIDMTSKQA